MRIALFIFSLRAFRQWGLCRLVSAILILSFSDPPIPLTSQEINVGPERTGIGIRKLPTPPTVLSQSNRPRAVCATSSNTLSFSTFTCPGEISKNLCRKSSISCFSSEERLVISLASHIELLKKSRKAHRVHWRGARQSSLAIVPAASCVQLILR